MDIPHNSGNYSDCPSVHAEQNAMLSASRKDLIGSTLYLAGEESIGCDEGDGRCKIKNATPCPICERIIKNAGIERIVGQQKEEVVTKCM